MFASNYESAGKIVTNTWLNSLPTDVFTKFVHDFQKLVVLDYIIRNTDRGGENWMIHHKNPNMVGALKGSLIEYCCF